MILHIKHLPTQLPSHQHFLQYLDNTLCILFADCIICVEAVCFLRRNVADDLYKNATLDSHLVLTYLLTYLLPYLYYLLNYIFTYLHINIVTYLLPYLLTYLPTCLLTYLLTHLLT